MEQKDVQWKDLTKGILNKKNLKFFGKYKRK